MSECGLTMTWTVMLRLIMMSVEPVVSERAMVVCGVSISRDSWLLQVDYSTNRKEAVPQVLAGPVATVSLPGGEGRMTICPPAWPFTACLTALALRESWAGRDWAGLGFNRQGSLSLSLSLSPFVCVCVISSTLRQTRCRTQWTFSSPVSQSATVRGTAAFVRPLIFSHNARILLERAFIFTFS